MRKFISAKPMTMAAIIFSICVITLFILNACRKMEHPDKSDPAESSVRKKFFTMPASTNPIVKAIAESIKRQDKQRDFVPELSKKAGFPIWDKAIIAKGSATMNDARLLGGGGSSNEVILLPFVKNGKNFTNAILLVNTGDPGAAHRDSSYQLVYMSRYEDFGFDYSDTTIAGARNVFHLFTAFDNEIFGYTNFIVKDSRIITGRSKDTTEETPLSLVDGHGTSYQNRLTSITFCNSYEICNLCGFRTTNTNNRVLEGCRCGSTLATYCTTVWFETGGGGLGGGQTTGGGGGGGGGGGWENTDPCRTVPNVSNPCGSNPSGYNPPTAGPGSGWVPVTDDDVEGIENFETWDVSPEDYLKIKQWKINGIDTTGLDKCIREILEKLLWNNQSIGKLLAKMDRAVFQPTDLDKFHITFKSRPMGIDTAGATLNQNYNPTTGYFSADIVMNTRWIDSSTQLGTAQTLVHEMIHAYLGSILYRYFYTLNPNFVANMSYDSMFSIYVDSLVVRHTRQGLNTYLASDYQLEHNYMADHFLEQYAELLEFMDDYRIANKRYYWFLAWGGLQKTKTWKQHWPNYPTWPPSNPSPAEDSTRGLKYAFTLARIDSILSAIGAEEKGRPSALGRPKIPGACY